MGKMIWLSGSDNLRRLYQMIIKAQLYEKEVRAMLV